MSQFSSRGGVILDLDGTALHEYQGVVRVPESIKTGLQAIHALHRPIILNTLRFPLSIIRTIGSEWLAINHVPIPVICLNGSVTGYIQRISEDSDDIQFEEILSHPLTEQEIDQMLDSVEKLLSAGLTEISLFYYPRDWKFGELIWTPNPEEIPRLDKKYTSCSAVVSTDLIKLRSEFKRLEVCMIFLLVNAEGDQLMAYQHTHKHSYFTHDAIDKKSGALQIAQHLNISLEDSIGAGDTELDTFLESVGLALQIKKKLPYQGRYATLEIEGAAQLGEFLATTAQLLTNI